MTAEEWAGLTVFVAALAAGLATKFGELRPVTEALAGVW